MDVDGVVGQDGRDGEVALRPSACGQLTTQLVEALLQPGDATGQSRARELSMWVGSAAAEGVGRAHLPPLPVQRYVDGGLGVDQHDRWPQGGFRELQVAEHPPAEAGQDRLHEPRSLGAASAIVGIILWVVAMVVDASLVAMILPILMVMGGGVLMARGGSGAASDGSRQA